MGNAKHSRVRRRSIWLELELLETRQALSLFGTSSLTPLFQAVTPSTSPVAIVPAALALPINGIGSVVNAVVSVPAPKLGIVVANLTGTATGLLLPSVPAVGTGVLTVVNDVLRTTAVLQPVVKTVESLPVVGPLARGVNVSVLAMSVNLSSGNAAGDSLGLSFNKLLTNVATITGGLGTLVLHAPVPVMETVDEVIGNHVVPLVTNALAGGDVVSVLPIVGAHPTTGDAPGTQGVPPAPGAGTASGAPPPLTQGAPPNTMVIPGPTASGTEAVTTNLQPSNSQPVREPTAAPANTVLSVVSGQPTSFAEVAVASSPNSPAQRNEAGAVQNPLIAGPPPWAVVGVAGDGAKISAMPLPVFALLSALVQPADNDAGAAVGDAVRDGTEAVVLPVTTMAAIGSDGDGDESAFFPGPQSAGPAVDVGAFGVDLSDGQIGQFLANFLAESGGWTLLAALGPRHLLLLLLATAVAACDIARRQLTVRQHTPAERSGLPGNIFSADPDGPIEMP